MMDKAKTSSKGSGWKRGRILLLACLAAVGILVAVSAAGAGTVCRAAEGDVMSPSGTISRDFWSAGKRLVDGLMEGSISPESGARVVSQIFVYASDGVLTKEEIESILEQIRRVDGINL